MPLRLPLLLRAPRPPCMATGRPLRHGRPRCVAVRAAADKSSSVSLLFALGAALHRAVLREDFTGAAQLRNQILTLDREAQLAVRAHGLQRQLAAAVAAEHYQEAAELRDQLVEALGERLALEVQRDPALARIPLPPHMQYLRHPDPSDDGASPSQLSEFYPPIQSKMIRNGVKVSVRSFYAPQQSSPVDNRYAFVFAVRIKNVGHAVVRLQASSWEVTDCWRNAQRFCAPGVAGHEVTLQPGQSFAYHSTVQLATATGSVDGMFDVVVQHSMLSAGGGGGNEEGAAYWGAPFKVPLGRVALNHKAPSWGGGADNPSAPA